MQETARKKYEVELGLMEVPHISTAQVTMITPFANRHNFSSTHLCLEGLIIT